MSGVAKLERLIYGSTATGGTDSLLNTATILGKSHRNNARDGLTGALAAHEGRYLQVVEGAPEVLDGLLRRLEADPRHRDIVLIDREPVEARLFAGWTMAHARITPSLKGVLEALLHNPAVDPGGTVAILHEASLVAFGGVREGPQPEPDHASRPLSPPAPGASADAA